MNVEIHNSLVRTPDGEVGEVVSYYPYQGHVNRRTDWAVVELPGTPISNMATKTYHGLPPRVQWWPVYDLQGVVD